MFLFQRDAFWRLLEQPMRPLIISNGVLEGLKWLALLSMFYDHGKRLLTSDGAIGPVTDFGRLAFPLFAFIIAYNLSRPGAGPSVYRRTLWRLIGFGSLALLATYYFFGAEFFNILFTFAVAIGIVWLFENWKTWWALPLALGLLMGLGPYVEYGWSGVLLILSFFAWCRFGLSIGVSVLLVIAFAFLNASNGNYWALLTLPLILCASVIDLPIKRSKWLFYVAYPVHLWILMALHWLFVRSVV